MSITAKIVMTPEELIRRHAARNKKVLYKQGAYSRTAMQRSMRYTSKDDKHSAPGSPPLAHKNKRRGPVLRKLIKFAVSESDQSVVAGPELVGRGSPTTPQILDKGGKARKAALNKTTFEVGDYGPIRYRGGGKFSRVLLETPAQSERATRLINEENAVRQSAGAFIKPRPFTVPILTDGGEKLRQLIAQEPL